MERYVALLRGIGPGNPDMRNDRLREAVTELGFDQVGSVLSSGNITFTAPATTNRADLEDTIQTGLRHHLGIPGGTIIRGRAELHELFSGTDAFAGLEHGQSTYLTATFLKHPPSIEVTPLPQPPSPTSRVLEYHGPSRAILACTDMTSGRTPDLMRWLESTFGTDITTRTWRTVERILKKL